MGVSTYKCTSVTSICKAFAVHLQAMELNFAEVYCSACIEKILFRLACSCVRKAAQKLVTDVNLGPVYTIPFSYENGTEMSYENGMV